MNRFTSEQVRVAMQEHLNEVAVSNDDGTTYDVQKCIIWDGIVRISIGSISDDITPEVAYDGTEGDMSQYSDDDSLEYIVDDILGGGPSYQGGSIDEVNEWVSELEG